ncbi:hypothetical protein MJO28_014013 [Puccinia striiformis f. sp. tritici]|uniref:Secreted protein n=4 Tax=Puccinia striiformis TaxID=27350 RepID=A0A0L0W0U8_9BASI|nr:hypothetical protein Pst134EA_025481 [Puccinia striiformis f. sp. tritici]KAI9627442.1 hypothetical protein KEM48_009828 [Puccinia striiformis f. sp. tritici PST-130]KNF05119.1 hypothetical protein PSTG_01748 [Puccinia striiformis f. sp. tritici PST-78]POV95393.1 hypothetical protein PSHT_15679 [Puccinia striiformis]KAH9443719.1 hypothetical protein Pst134EB_026116 [Puccinia striiformis f. sp. tritici]KAH9451531.1 hypothetical protein Pst134EA_025481 [Puccinia striiformis f. sp. tritici]
MNLLRARFITFALVSLIIGLHSGQVAARRVACDAHFAPLFDPTGNTVAKASCISKSNPHQDNKCVLGSCGYREPHSYTHWSNLQFQNCHHGEPNPNRDVVDVEQYFRYDTYVSAQDHTNKIWYDCDYSRAEENKKYLSCYDCP